MSPRASSLAAALLAAAVQLPFLGKAVHMDEPVFLYAAEHALLEPGRPGNFPFNWYGAAEPMSRVNNNPPGLAYLLAGLRRAGVSEIKSLRLALLPLDMLAAAALFGLAALFLKSPLLPTLAVIASPVWVVNMTHLQAEKPALALGAAGLYLAARSAGEDSRALWPAGVLLAAASLFKFGALLFVFPAACFLWHRGAGARRTGLFALGAALPLAAVLLWDFFRGGEGLGPALTVLAQAGGSWAAKAHQLRAFLCFTGGACLAVLAWPWAAPGVTRKTLAGAAAVSALLLLPWWDAEPVRALDRATGLAFAAAGAAALGLCVGARARSLRGWALWAPWILAASVLQLGFYWSVLARLTLFLVPPLVFLLAELHESEGGLSEPALRATVLASLTLSLALGAVDFRYAGAQREAAEEMERRYLSEGRRVWYAGHWGLQYYLAQKGAAQIDEAAGGYGALRPGDILLASRVNSNNSRLGRPALDRDHRLSELSRRTVDFPIPLRLLSGWSGQGGFYADSWGFLPFSLSREPVDEFVAGEHL